MELGYRLRDLGAHFQFEPEANVFHYASRSFDAWCRIPYHYGRYDVAMSRDKGHEALACALREFRSRHPINRMLARLLAGRRRALNGVVLLLRAATRGADRLPVRRAASAPLSLIFNLLYWQGVCDELGGRRALVYALSSAEVS